MYYMPLLASHNNLPITAIACGVYWGHISLVLIVVMLIERSAPTMRNAPTGFGGVYAGLIANRL